MTASLEHPSSKILPLESGDRMNRYEFERRYVAMPNVKKAELIEGIVYIASPPRYKSHAEPHATLIGCLGNYKVSTQGVEIAGNTTVRLDLDNEPQPDVVLLIEESCGGQARISDDDYIEGAPELVAEVAASSASIDLHDKKKAYRRNVVREYIVWRVLENKLDWFSLEDGEYITLTADDSGVIKSKVFPGLWLHVDALLTGNIAQVLAMLQQGLSSNEHVEFVQSLSQNS